jgi:uncharacterized DUF497 family protein
VRGLCSATGGNAPSAVADPGAQASAAVFNNCPPARRLPTTPPTVKVFRPVAAPGLTVCAGRHILYTIMDFEFDARKSKRNLAKHGIDFSEAQKRWNDPNLLEVPARTGDEPRFIVIGMIGSKHWSAVVTYRSEDVRIISVRRSRDEEVRIYESKEI